MSLIPTFDLYESNYSVDEEIDTWCNNFLNHVALEMESSHMNNGVIYEDYQFINTNLFDINMTNNLKLAKEFLYIALIDNGNESYIWQIYVL